jgi:hypothetical protein
MTEPIALVAADLAVAGPVIGTPRMVRLALHFISGRIKGISGIQVWPPPLPGDLGLPKGDAGGG